MTGRLMLAVVLTAGCGAPEAAPAVAVFEDPEGNPVMIDSLPTGRIVSTLQSATEWIVALGAADKLVARTDYDQQPELVHLPSLGGGLEISPE
ncbi:MAG TPA: hypothetical protein PLL69_11855, partial [Gemmatimonadales bacterium]|nr:hypothetical protein [Gemmatimonadales bacterium]